MALDQYGGFGMGTPVPRRIYALVRLSSGGGAAKYEGGSGNGGIIEGVGGGMKIEGVTGVPYATVSALPLALHVCANMQLKRLPIVDSRISTCSSSSGAPWWGRRSGDQVCRCSCVLCARYVHLYPIIQRAVMMPFVDSPYQDRITLKAPHTDQILGLCVLPLSQPPVHYLPEEQEYAEGLAPEEVLILTAGVLMRARVNLGSVMAFSEA